jgi:ferredoxin
MPERHPLNAPGDFYVERGQCISCGAPEAEAPMLMAYDEEEGCYFRRQPETDEEVQCAINATWASCMAAPRYAGTDERVRIRLSVLGSRNSCDHPIEPAVDPQTHVRFSVDIEDARALVRRFVRPSPFGAVVHVEGSVAKPAAELWWNGSVLYGIERQSDQAGVPTWLLYNARGTHLALAHILQELGATNILWFSKHEWENQMPGHATPY